VNTSVVNMNTLITKCQELHEDLKPIELLANQVRDIKKALDLFEIYVNRLTK